MQMKKWLLTNEILEINSIFGGSLWKETTCTNNRNVKFRYPPHSYLRFYEVDLMVFVFNMHTFANSIAGCCCRHHRSHRLNCNRYIHTCSIKVLMIICVVLINCCGFVKTIETASLLNNNGGHTKSSSSSSSTSSIRSMILPSTTSKQQPSTPPPQQQQQQPKPSSVIYIPSLDGIKYY